MAKTYIATYDVDISNAGEVDKARKQITADHVTKRVMNVLEDYFEGSGVEIKDEPELREWIKTEIFVCLAELSL